MLLGLQDGAVLQTFVNNAFPVELVKVTAPVICCAMSLHRRKVSGEAIMDVQRQTAVQYSCGNKQCYNRLLYIVFAKGILLCPFMRVRQKSTECVQ